MVKRMRNRPVLSTLCTTVALLGAATSADCWGQSRTEPVRVALRPRTEVSNRIVQLHELADLSGGDPQLRARMAQLDVSEPPPKGRSSIVSRTQVAIRLQLANISRDAFEMTGAERVSFILKQPRISDEEVLDALRSPLARQLQIAVEDLDIRLMQSIASWADLPSEAESATLEPMLPAAVRLGPLRVMMAIRVDGDLLRTAAVSVETRVFRSVPKATRPIQRGELCSVDNIQLQRVAVSANVLKDLDENVFGKSVRRSMDLGEIVRSSDLQAAPEREQPFLVQPRDVVRLIARKGGLTVIVDSVEVLQRGRLGDRVRVRNTRSRQIVSGKVVSASEVEVQL